MGITGNNIQNSGLVALAQRAGPQVTGAIRQASLKTGVDFAYMMEKAAAESSFDTDAKARTSSAKGLYQFIESTWMQMVNRYGDKHGLGAYADKISDSGKAATAEDRRAILALRDDPEVASLMAGEFAAENKRTLMNSGIKESDIGPTELYLAHFLGAGSASQFIKAMKENPLTPAADLFPKAAKANKNVFYNSTTQQAKSLGTVYAFFDKKFSSGSDESDTTTIADATSSIPKPSTKPQVERIITGTEDKNKLSPELMAYLNGEKNTYQAMQMETIELLSTRATATAPSFPLPTLTPTALSSNPAQIMMMAASLDLPGTMATRR